jgi:hypothetical protein
MSNGDGDPDCLRCNHPNGHHRVGGHSLAWIRLGACTVIDCKCDGFVGHGLAADGLVGERHRLDRVRGLLEAAQKRMSDHVPWTEPFGLVWNAIRYSLALLPASAVEPDCRGSEGGVNLMCELEAGHSGPHGGDAGSMRQVINAPKNPCPYTLRWVPGPSLQT